MEVAVIRLVVGACVGIFLFSNILAFAQPTPREELVVWSWRGTPLWERAEAESRHIAHLRYGDSVLLPEHYTKPSSVGITFSRGEKINRVKFPEWSEKAEWIEVQTKSGKSGFVPSLYLSEQPPLLMDTTTKRPRESMDDYFFRTRGLLEGKPIHRKIEDVGRYYRRSVFPLYVLNRSVYEGGVVFEWRYAVADHDNFLLILPDWSLVEAFYFLNAFYNLEAQQQRGFGDNIRLTKRKENLLIFSNNYAGGGKKGERRKQFTIQRIGETIIISMEELIVD